MTHTHTSLSPQQLQNTVPASPTVLPGGPFAPLCPRIPVPGGPLSPFSPGIPKKKTEKQQKSLSHQ